MSMRRDGATVAVRRGSSYRGFPEMTLRVPDLMLVYSRLLPIWLPQPHSAGVTVSLRFCPRRVTMSMRREEATSAPARNDRKALLG